MVFRAALLLVDRYAVALALGSHDTVALLPGTLDVSFAENVWTSPAATPSRLGVDPTEQTVRVKCHAPSACILFPDDSASSAMGGVIARASGFGWGWFGATTSASSLHGLDWHPLGTRCRIESSEMDWSDEDAAARDEMLARLGLADEWMLEATDSLWAAAAAAVQQPRMVRSAPWERLRRQLRMWPRQPTPDEVPPKKDRRRTQDSREWDTADDWDISGEPLPLECTHKERQQTEAEPLEPLIRELVEEARTKDVLDILRRELHSHGSRWADRVLSNTDSGYSVAQWVSTWLNKS